MVLPGIIAGAEMGDREIINPLRRFPTTGTSNDIDSNIATEKIKQNLSLLRPNDVDKPYDRKLLGFGSGSGANDRDSYTTAIDGIDTPDNEFSSDDSVQSEGFGADDTTSGTYGSGSTSSGYDNNWGPSDSSSGSGYGGSSSSSYGGSSTYGSSPSSTYGSSSSSSYGGSSSYGKSSYGKSYFGKNSYGRRKPVQIRLSWAIILTATLLTVGMLVTAHQFVSNPKGKYAGWCRSSIETLECIWKICYNLYHCRLGEIHDALCAIDDEDDYTEQELQTMKLRPGIEKALTVEHNRAIKKMTGKDRKGKVTGKKVVKKVGNKIQKKILEKIGPIRKGPGMLSMV